MNKRQEKKRIAANHAKVDAYKKKHHRTVVVYKAKIVDGKMILTDRREPDGTR